MSERFPDVPLQELDDLNRAMRYWMVEVEEGLQRDRQGAPWVREPAAPVLGDSRRPHFALLHSGAIAAVVIDRAGKTLAASPSFIKASGEALLRDVLLSRVISARATCREVVEIESSAVATRSFVVAYTPAALAAEWRLPPSIHQAAAAAPDSVVLLSMNIDHQAEPLLAACRTYGMTELQARVAVATICGGGVKEAARRLGLSYHTAREALVDAKKRVGVPRLPSLVMRLTTLAFGVLPGHEQSAAMLTDLWGLTERQVALAALVAEGLTRRQIARALGISEALVKKDIESAFNLMQVESASALARRTVEARAFAWLTNATSGEFAYVDDSVEPLRIAYRRDGGQVAWSDYGPASGKPVLIIHSSMSTRIVSRKLVRALQKSGYRPISIDRPGFGLSDPLVEEGEVQQGPWHAAAKDVALVLGLLKLRSVDVVSRGAAQFVTTLQAVMPGVFGRVVIVNPGPPYRYSGKGKGPFALLKIAFLRNPGTIAVFAPYLARLFTHARFSKVVAQWLSGSPPDHLAAQDPEIINDLYRSMRMFAVGRYEGFIAEQAAITADAERSPITGTANWRVILGTSDVLYDPDTVIDYWREMLPEARFEIVPDGGRLLAMTHPHLVVEALAAA